MTDDTTDAGADPLEAIRAGKPLYYAYDVYGTGRVRLTISWDAEAGSFVEEREDCDMGGDTHKSRCTIDEEAARRHVRSSRT